MFLGSDFGSRGGVLRDFVIFWMVFSIFCRKCHFFEVPADFLGSNYKYKILWGVEKGVARAFFDGFRENREKGVSEAPKNDQKSCFPALTRQNRGPKRENRRFRAEIDHFLIKIRGS